MTTAARAVDVEHMLACTAGLWDDLRGERIVITGGTGFVGSWLLEAFAAANRAYSLGAEVVVLTRDARRFRERAPHLANAPGIALWSGRADDFAFPSGTFAYVVHAATERAYKSDAAHPFGILADDRAATERVLDFCVQARARRLLFTSSGAVYGRQPADCEMVREDDMFAPDPTDVDAVYGHSKRLSEFMCAASARAHGFDATIARLFAFVGPGLPLDEGYAVGNFLRDVLANRPVRISGDGTARRSYLYAADLAVWLWTMLLRGQSGRAYNVGSSLAVSIAELARTVVASTGSDVAVEIANTPVAGVPPARYVPSTERAQAELGLRAHIDLAEGIRRMYAYHRSPTDNARMTTN
ncbi:MAG: NAD(P)-dependent oxidoreductase [Candidatus Velthaea sp.]